MVNCLCTHKNVNSALVFTRCDATREINTIHYDVIKWKRFPRYYSFVRGIHQWPVVSPTQRLPWWPPAGCNNALMYLLIFTMNFCYGLLLCSVGNKTYYLLLLPKTSGAKLWCFLWSALEQKIEQTVETPVIWDAIAPIMTTLQWTTPKWMRKQFTKTVPKFSGFYTS